MSSGWTKQDAVRDGIYKALERWDEAERRARDLRQITKANVTRVDRSPDGSRIPTPRRSALARYLTAAALTAIREWERAEAQTPEPNTVTTAIPTWREGVKPMSREGGRMSSEPRPPRNDYARDRADEYTEDVRGPREPRSRDHSPFAVDRLGPCGAFGIVVNFVVRQSR